MARWPGNHLRRKKPGSGSGLLIPVEDAPPALRREACATCPLAVGALRCQQPGTPSLGRYSRALCGNDFDGRVNEIAKHLPANCGVRGEKPVQHGHATEYTQPLC
jgi:hypothetical protein